MSSTSDANKPGATPETRLAYFDLTAADAERLRVYRADAEPVIDGIIAQFYDHLLAFPPLKQLLEVPPDRIDRLKDLQRDYFPGGKFELPGIERTVERASSLIALFRAQGMPVIHVRQIEKDEAVGFLLDGTPGIEIDPRVKPQGEDMLITKCYPNAFRDTTLARIIHALGAKELFSAAR